jgi:phosphatidylserine/phosphatidylglycerophosphate/cardiolipin synthase-like enzyme
MPSPTKMPALHSSSGARATQWSLYSSNEDAWKAMLADCAAAKESIVLEQFIFTKDEFGQKLIDICAERAAAGVKVRFLWDAYGSFTFWGSNIVEELRGKGIELVFWKTLVPAYNHVPNASVPGSCAITAGRSSSTRRSATPAVSASATI